MKFDVNKSEGLLIALIDDFMMGYDDTTEAIDRLIDFGFTLDDLETLGVNKELIDEYRNVDV